MWNRLKNKIFRKEASFDFNQILTEAEAIRNNSDVLVLYGSPTKGSWLGIANATKGLFPKKALELPQWYSNSQMTPLQTKELLLQISKLQFKEVIFSGFASYLFEWIEALHSDTSIGVIFHGTISEFHEVSKKEFIHNLLIFGKQNKIKRFGFVKKGLAEVFHKLYQLDCYHQPLNTPVIPKNISKLNLDSSKTHIGVFGADTFNKNLHNQVIHALMIENSILHVLDKSIFSYLDMDERIVEYGSHLPKEKFLSILGSMDLNLYLSYSESWGLVAYESEAMGVPCIKMDHVDYENLIKKQLSKKD